MAAKDNACRTQLSDGHFDKSSGCVESGCLNKNVQLITDRTNSCLPFATGMSTHELLFGKLSGNLSKLCRC